MVILPYSQRASSMSNGFINFISENRVYWPANFFLSSLIPLHHTLRAPVLGWTNEYI